MDEEVTTVCSVCGISIDSSIGSIKTVSGKIAHYDCFFGAVMRESDEQQDTKRTEAMMKFINGEEV